MLKSHKIQRVVQFNKDCKSVWDRIYTNCGVMFPRQTGFVLTMEHVEGGISHQWFKTKKKCVARLVAVMEGTEKF